MSNSVDNRVVSMEFDNAKFERNVAQSLDTLKHLDKSLDGLTNSSKKFDGVSFEDLANSIDSIANRFTLMGRITQKVFDEIASGVVNLGKKLVSFNIDQVSSGWEKYADKTSSVQTIMSATGREIEYVEEQLGRLNRFTDETSFSFTDMTSNIAKFTSQGIELDEAVTAMQGIATWAASAGQNAQAASRAMYNISQAMGAGSMKMIDWKSIQNANMATKEFKEQAIAAAVSVGTLTQKEGKFVTEVKDHEVNIANFTETLKDGWFDTKTMNKVFTEYGKFADLIDSTYEEFDEKITVSKLLQLAEAQKTLASSFEDDLAKAADSAGADINDLRKAISELNEEQYEFSMKTYKSAQEARTWSDTVSATADAVSTSWMNVFQAIFGNYEKQRTLWTDLANQFYDWFAAPVNKLGEFISEVMDGTDETSKASYTLQEAMDRSGVSLLDFGDVAVKALKNQGLLTDEMIESAGSIEEAMKQVTGTSDQFRSVIDEMLDSNVSSLQTAEEAFEDYKKVAREVLHGDWGNGHERKDALEAAGYDYRTVQIFAEKMHEGIGIVESDMWRVELKTKGFTDAEIEALEKFRDSLEDTAETADETVDKIEKLSGRELLFGREEGARGILYNLMDTITEFGNVVSDTWDKVFPKGDRNPVENAHKLLVRFNKFTAGLLNTVKTSEDLRTVLQGFFSVLNIVKNALSAVFQIFRNFVGIFTPVKKGFKDVVVQFAEWMIQLNEWIENNQVFEKVVARVTTAFTNLKTAIDPLVEKVRELWSNFKITNGIQTVGDFFRTVFNTAVTYGATAVQTLTNVFSKLITNVRSFLGTHFASLNENVEAFFVKVRNGGSTAISTFVRIKNAVVDFFKIFIDFVKTRDYEAFIKNLGERFKGITEFVTKSKDSIKKWFSQCDEATGKNILKLATALLTMVTVFSLLKRFGTIHGAIINLFNSLSSAVNVLKRNIQTNNVLKIAASIGILVGALLILAYMPTDKMEQGLKALGKIMMGFFALMGVVAAIAILGKGANLTSLGTVLGGVAAILLSAALSLMILTKQVDYSRIRQALGTLLGVLAMAVFGVILISRLAGKGSTSMGSMLALAAGILLMVYALEKIQNSAAVLSPTTFKKFFTLIGMLALASFALKKGISLGSALGLLVFILSLSLINKTLIKLMDEIPDPAVYQEKMGNLWGLIKVISAIALALRVAGKGRFGTSLGILVTILGIYEIAKIAVNLGNMADPVSLNQGINAVESIGYLLAALILVTGIAARLSKGSKGFSTSVIALVIALIAIGIEMAVLGKMGWDKLKPGIIAMAIALGGLAAVILSLGYLAKDFKKESLLSLIEALGILALVVAAILVLQAYGDPSTMLSTAASLGLVMLALAASMKIISSVSFKGFDSTEAWQMIIKMLVMAGAAVGILFALQAMGITASIETVSALCLLVIALSFAAVILSYAQGNLGTAAAQALLVVGLAASLVLIAFAMQKLNSVNVDGLLPKVESLALLLAALGALIFIFSLIPSLSAVGGIVAGVIGFIALLAGFTILAEAIGWLSGYKWFATNLERFATTMGTCIGKFKAALQESNPEEASEGVSKIQKLAEDLQGLVEVLNGIDLDSESVGALADVLIAFGKAELATAISNILNNWAGATDGSLQQQLTGFANAITAYVNTIHTVTESDLNKATKITNSVSALLNAVPKEGGVAGWLLGKKSEGMKNLSENLESFGTAIIGFGQNLAGIDDSTVSNVTKASEAMTPLTELIDKMPKQGGVWQDIIGTADIETFGEKLNTFVKALIGENGDGLFENIRKIGDEDVTAIGKLKEVTTALTDATSSIPTLGGYIDVIFGTDSPDSFGTQMVTFCEKIIEIGEKAQGITDTHIDSIDKATEAAYALNAFSNAMYGTSLPTSAGENTVQSAQNVADSTNILASAPVGQASQNVDKYKEMYGQLKDTVSGNGSSGLPSFDVSGMTSAFDSLQEHASSAIQGILSTFSDNSSNLETAGSGAIDSVITGMSSKEGDLLEEAKTLADKTAEGYSSNTEATVTAGENIALSLISGMMNKFSAPEFTAQIPTSIATALTNIPSDGLSSVGQTLVDTIATSIDESTGTITISGNNLALALCQGFTDKQTDLETAAKTASMTGSEAVSSTQSAWVTVGELIGEGLAQGLRNKTADVQTAAATLAAAAEAAIRLAAAINSPSRVTTRLGEYFGEGFGKGIRNMFGYVSSQSSSLSDAATNAISEAARLASAIVESDANPVITPVLDLSEVRRGASIISNLGGFAASVSASTASMVSSSAAARQIQNGTPTPVTAVLSDSAALALAGSHATQQIPVIEFTGDLAQVARILQPKIKMVDNNHGKSLVR